MDLTTPFPRHWTRSSLEIPSELLTPPFPQTRSSHQNRRTDSTSPPPANHAGPSRNKYEERVGGRQGARGRRGRAKWRPWGAGRHRGGGRSGRGNVRPGGKKKVSSRSRPIDQSRPAGGGLCHKCRVACGGNSPTGRRHRTDVRYTSPHFWRQPPSLRSNPRTERSSEILR